MKSNFVGRAATFLKNKVLFDISETAAVLSGEAVCAYWSRLPDTKNNFGDAINPIVIEYLAGKRAAHSNKVFYFGWWPTIYCIGSILDNLSQGGAVIAGAGFKSSNARIRRKPKHIIATRGPLTKIKFDDAGITCPSIFCDPGLLISRIFPPLSEPKTYDFGIIPHYVDKEYSSGIAVKSGGKTYRWIDIEAEPAQVAKNILSCRKIISSSLHGIITAHAYGVPAAWMRITDLVGGDGFKFQDYYASLGVTEPRFYQAAGGIDLGIVERYCSTFEVEALIDDFIDAFRSQITKLA